MTTFFLAKTYRFFFLPYLGLLFLCLPISADAQDGIIRHFDTDDGLPGLVVYRSIQSSDGYLWFATNKGLCRYDGEVFTTLESPELRNNEILAVWEFQNKVWFINLLFQLFYIEENEIVRFNPEGILSEVEITELFIDDQDRYWITNKRSLFLLEKDKKDDFQLKYFDFDSYVDIVFQISPKSVALLLRNQIYEYNESEKTFEVLKSIVKGGEELPPNNDYLTIKSIGGYPFFLSKDTSYHPFNKYKESITNFNSSFLTTEDAYWLSSEEGLFKIFKKNDQIQNHTSLVNNNRINNIISDFNGNIWFCTNGDGVYMLQNNSIQNYTVQNSDLPSNYIYKIKGDLKRHIYIASKNGWLSLLDNNHFTNYKISNSNQEFYCLSVNEDKVIASCNGAYSMHKNKDGTLDGKRQIQTNAPKMIFLDGEEFWISHHDGVFKSTKGNIEKITSFRSYALQKDFDNLMWIGTPSGLYYFDNKVQPKISATGDYKELTGNKMLNQLSSNVNLGYNGPIGKFHRNSTKPNYYYTYESPPFNKFMSKNCISIDHDITAIERSSDSIIWVLTKTNGIYKIDKNHEVQIINQETGLLSNFGNCLFIDAEDNVWVGTANGVNFIDRKSKTIRNITIDNGLLSNNITAIYKQDQDVFVGTNKGVSVFNENELKPTLVSDILIQQIKVQGRDTSIEEAYSLPYHQNNLFIDFVSISFNEKVNYEYQLVGLDGDWIEIKESYVRFSDLSPGDYIFKVRGVLGNKSQGESAIIHFNIIPPFWKRIWFYLLCGLSFLIGLGFILKYWRKKIENKANKQLELERKFAQMELQALQSQMNPHFVFNALNSIQNFILRENKVEASNYLSKFARLMRLFLESSRNKYINLKDELDLLKLYIELERLRFQNKFEFNIKVEDGLPLDIEIPSMLLQPFIENAINHGLANKKGKGALNLILQSEENQISCIIQDNGIGRENAYLLQKESLKKHRSLGMEIVKDRLMVLSLLDNYEVQIKISDLNKNAEKNKGTQVKILIPIDF